MIIFKLKKLLEEQKMSLTELSEKTGISRTSLSQLSTGKSQGIQFDTLENIALALDVRPGDLFDMKITFSDSKIDFVAINTKYDSTFSVVVIFKLLIKDMTFWIGLNVILDFETEDDSILCNVRWAREDFINALIIKKYGEQVKASDPKKATIFIRKSLTESKKNILDSFDEKSFFSNALLYVKLALSFLGLRKLKLPNNKNRLILEQEFLANKLSSSTRSLIKEKELEEYVNTSIMYEYKIKLINPYLYELVKDEPINIKSELFKNSIDFSNFDFMDIDTE